MDSPGELLRTVRLVQHVVSKGLQVSQVGAMIIGLAPSTLKAMLEDALQESTTETAEVAVLRVVDLSNTPGVDPGADGLAVNLNLLLRTNDREGHHRAELAVVLNGILVVFLHVVREVVNGDIIVLDVLHDLPIFMDTHFELNLMPSTYPLLEATQLTRRQRIGLANDGDHIDTRREATHELDVDLPQPVLKMSFEQSRVGFGVHTHDR